MYNLETNSFTMCNKPSCSHWKLAFFVMLYNIILYFWIFLLSSYLKLQFRSRFFIHNTSIKYISEAGVYHK